jgi:hypothetical protein
MACLNAAHSRHPSTASMLLLLSLPQLLTSCVPEGTVRSCPRRVLWDHGSGRGSGLSSPIIGSSPRWFPQRARPVLRLVGGRGGKGRHRRAHKQLQHVSAFGPAEAQGEPVALERAETAGEHVALGRSAASNPVEDVADDPALEKHESDIVYGNDLGADTAASDVFSDADESEEWARPQTTYQRWRQEEDDYLVRQFGGDLSTVAKDQHKLKSREWDTLDRTLRDTTLSKDSEVVTLAERKRREEEALKKAAGGGLEALGKPRLSMLEREKVTQAPDLDVAWVSTKERKRLEEEALVKTFGGGLSAMATRDKTHLRGQAWEMASEQTHLRGQEKETVSASEWKRREDEKLLNSFGGGLDTLVKRESALERAKRESRFRRAKGGSRSREKGGGARSTRRDEPTIQPDGNRGGGRQDPAVSSPLAEYARGEEVEL